MHYLIGSFTQIVRADKPTNEQVAGALATSYAIGRGKSVPVKKAIDEDVDRAELFMPGFDLHGIVEAEDPKAAVEKVVKLYFKGSIDADKRLFAFPLSDGLFRPDLTLVLD